MSVAIPEQTGALSCGGEEQVEAGNKVKDDPENADAIKVAFMIDLQDRS